tara:strand:+ start:165 stop:356 length:192 start_codon:yes stop_codon:yes gene_type:complete
MEKINLEISNFFEVKTKKNKDKIDYTLIVKKPDDLKKEEWDILTIKIYKIFKPLGLKVTKTNV